MLSKTQKLLLFSQVIDFSSAGKCPFGFGSSSDEAKPEDQQVPPPILDSLTSGHGGDHVVRKLAESAKYPADILTCKGKKAALKTVSDFNHEDYEAVVESVIELYEDTEDKAAFAAGLVRLAGHDFMDFRYLGETKTNKRGKKMLIASDMKGGSDGCINFADKDNAGLAEFMQKFKLPSAYEDHCDEVSVADFIVIAAEAVMGKTAKIPQSCNKLDRFAPGTLARAFKDQFKAGRTTAETCDWNKDLMPDAEAGCNDVNSVFVDHIYKFQGMQKKDFTAAIMGAHTIGRARPENSGYDGSWSSKESEGVFDNDYYKQILTRGWGPELNVGGRTDNNQWKIVDRAGSESDHKQMMLNSDMCLAYDNNSIHQECMKKNDNNPRKCKQFQNKGKPLNALGAGNCCAWTNKGALFNNHVFDKKNSGMLCGKMTNKHGKGFSFKEVRAECCASEAQDSIGDCDSSQWPKGQMFRKVLDFAGDETKWLDNYVQSWKVATENGHLDLRTPLADSSASVTEQLYECGKLKTRQLCRGDDNCTWNVKKVRGKRMQRHCLFKQ